MAPDSDPSPSSNLPESDPDVAALRQRDGRFVRRLVLIGAVVLLAGAWAVLMLGEADVGAGVAAGFRALTQ